jgi:hypothetical protein
MESGSNRKSVDFRCKGSFPSAVHITHRKREARAFPPEPSARRHRPPRPAAMGCLSRRPAESELHLQSYAGPKKLAISVSLPPVTSHRRLALWASGYSRQTLRFDLSNTGTTHRKVGRLAASVIFPRNCSGTPWRGSLTSVVRRSKGGSLSYPLTLLVT